MLQLSQANTKTPKLVVEGMRAIAFLMEDITKSQLVDDITNAVMFKLTSDLDSSLATDEVTVGLRTSVSESLTMLREEVQGITQQLKNVASGVAHATPALEDGQLPAPTYANTTCQGIPPAHAATIAQANMLEKQIVIDKDPNLDTNSLENLTEKEVVSKANIALSLMGICAEDVPEGITFVGAQKL